jgi:hypothetical protein
MTAVLTMKDGQKALTKYIDMHKELFWVGAITQRIDCCRCLLAPEGDEIEAVITVLLKSKTEGMHKETKVIYDYMIARLRNCYGHISTSLVIARDHLDYIEKAYRLLQEFSSEFSSASEEYYRWRAGLYPSAREAKKADRARDAWGFGKELLEQCKCRVVTSEELLEWRKKAFKRWPTVYNAYIIRLNHAQERAVKYVWAEPDDIEKRKAQYLHLIDESTGDSASNEMHQQAWLSLHAMSMIDDAVESFHRVITQKTGTLMPLIEHAAMGAASYEEQQEIAYMKKVLEQISNLMVKKVE